MEEVQVYLFTGFLDAGKTKFIRETLQDKRFNDKEPTLLLVCEEGEEEYEPDAPYMKNVTIRTLGDMSEFNEENLKRLTAEAKESCAGRKRLAEFSRRKNILSRRRLMRD